jgi:hypothetical protein
VLGAIGDLLGFGSARGFSTRNAFIRAALACKYGETPGENGYVVLLERGRWRREANNRWGTFVVGG